MEACPPLAVVLRIECDLCGKVVTINEAHAATSMRGRPLYEILELFRHDGCGGVPAKAELLTGVAGASARLARRIVLRG